LLADTLVVWCTEFSRMPFFQTGLDRERLTFQHNGIQGRLTNVEGHVIHEI